MNPIPARWRTGCAALSALCALVLGLGTMHLPAQGTVSTFSFTNAAALVPPEYGPAGVFPSVIELSGLGGTILKVSANLLGLSHTYPDDFDVLLVGPGGQNVLLMSDAGGGTSVNNLTLTFSDTAASSLPSASALTSGTFKPTNYGLGDTFPAPAPAGPFPDPQLLSVFNGSNPNGKWSLYVFDDLPGNSGAMNRGWALSLTVSNFVCCPGEPEADVSVTVSDSPDPVQPGSNYTYTVRVVNNGPATASAVMVTNVLPADASFVSANTSQGTNSRSGALVTGTLGTLNVGAVAVLTVTATAPASGTLTNVASVTCSQTDNDPVNNVATTRTTVSLPPLTLSVSDVSVLEGDVGVTQAVFTVSLSRSNFQAVYVDYFTSSGTASAGTDYFSAADTLTFYPGTTNLSVSVLVYGDIITEPNETFFLGLRNATNAIIGRSTGTATIINDDGLAGQIDHFNFSSVPTQQFALTPFPLTVTAKDVSNNTITGFNGPVTLKGLVGAGSEVSILISEIDTGPTNQVEFANVSGGSIDLSGWQITIYDWLFWPDPEYTFTVPAGTVCAANEVFVLRSSGVAPGTYPNFSAGQGGLWMNDPTGNQVAILLQDNIGRVTDFACAFDADPAMIRLPVAIAANQWTGAPILVNTNSALTFQRAGSTDSNNSNNWVIASGTVGAFNSGLSKVFPGALPVAVSPVQISSFAAGVWSGNVTVLRGVTNVYLRATDLEGHTGTGNTFVVAVTNHTPIIAPVPNQVVMQGDTMVVTNVASDVDPGQKLTFSLAGGAPAGATIDPATGVLIWATGQAPAPSTNLIPVVVKDNGIPSLSSTQSVGVFVTIRTSPDLFFTRTVRSPGTLSTVKYTASAGYMYDVQYRGTGSTGTWSTLSQTSVPGVLTNVVVSDPIGARNNRFYRVKNVTAPFQPPKLGSPACVGGVFALQFTGEAGRVYAVECADALGTNSWQVLTNLSVPAITNSSSYSIPSEFNSGGYDFRVNQLTVPVPPAQIEAPGPIGNQFQLTFQAAPGLSYAVEASSTLNPGSWSVVTNVGPLESAASIVVADMLSTQRFYRVNAVVPAQSAQGFALQPSPDTFDLSFACAPGKQYTVEFADTLGSGWQVLTNLTVSAGVTNVLVRDYGPLPPQRFYRIRTPY
jgi:uncharacterized repeat protein (TIGR01451 family)